MAHALADGLRVDAGGQGDGRVAVAQAVEVERGVEFGAFERRAHVAAVEVPGGERAARGVRVVRGEGDGEDQIVRLVARPGLQALL